MPPACFQNTRLDFVWFDSSHLGLDWRGGDAPLGSTRIATYVATLPATPFLVGNSYTHTLATSLRFANVFSHTIYPHTCSPAAFLLTTRAIPAARYAPTTPPLPAAPLPPPPCAPPFPSTRTLPLPRCLAAGSRRFFPSATRTAACAQRATRAYACILHGGTYRRPYRRCRPSCRVA